MNCPTNSAESAPPEKSNTIVLNSFCGLLVNGDNASEQIGGHLACLQLLFACEPLREHFIEKATDCGKVYLALAELFATMKSHVQQTDQPLDVTALYRNLQESIISHEPTAADFLVALLRTADGELSDRDLSINRHTELDRLALVELQFHTVCLTCKHTNFPENTRQWTLPLLVQGKEENLKLTQCINAFFSGQTSNSYCNKCHGFRMSSKLPKMEHYPQVLLIQLRRPDRVDESKSETGRLSVNESFQLSDKTYVLAGALLHRGGPTPSTGYLTLVRQSPDSWVQLDGPRMQIIVDRVTAQEQLDKFAYLLLYTRQITTEEVLGSFETNELDRWTEKHMQQVERYLSVPEQGPFEQKAVPSSPPPSRGPDPVPFPNDKLCGLENLGFSCYANACLQMLYTLPVTREYFLTSPQYGPFHRTLSKLFSAMEIESAQPSTFNQPIASVQPKHFMAQFRAAKADFREYQMADAQEFISLLLELVHQEANQATQKNKPEDKSKNAEEAWQYHVTHVDQSFLSGQFMGQMQTTLCCSVCKHESHSWCCIWQLQLPLGPEETSPNCKETNCLTLSKCIKEFLSDEILNDESRPFCEQCKSLQTATKRSTICRTAKLLLVHLKRFTANGSKKRHRVSIDERIQLDSRPFELVSVVLHKGSESFGHYFTLHRQEDQSWVKLDDQKITRQVKSTLAEQLISEDAYLCLYRASQ